VQQPSSPGDGSDRAMAAADRLGLTYVVTRHGPVGSLAEAAVARGVSPNAVVKTLVVRLRDKDYRFVLVPGDREISWPKLRGLLGVNRLSMPDAATARDVTGYVRGSITPLGSTHDWPVVADSTLDGTVSLGAGAPGVALSVAADALVAALGATVADVTEPATGEGDRSLGPAPPGPRQLVRGTGRCSTPCRSTCPAPCPACR
jgi:Cys-tRNA(Pro)/Cys-tRNA(Cys) deacylase